jgi:hypothetical protein
VVSFPLELKLQVILLLGEALAYLALAGWCLSRGRKGRWAVAAAIGAALIGVILGLSAAASFEQIFLQSSHLDETLFIHRHVYTLFAVGRVAGVLLLAAGFVLSRRTQPVADRSIYGP